MKVTAETLNKRNILLHKLSSIVKKICTTNCKQTLFYNNFIAHKKYLHTFRMKLVARL